MRPRTGLLRATSVVQSCDTEPGTPERAPSSEERGMRGAAWLFVVTLVVTACAPAEEPGGSAGAGDGDGEVEGSIRVALGDIEGVETLNLLIALERVKERGVDVELTEFAEEDLAAEAVLGG